VQLWQYTKSKVEKTTIGDEGTMWLQVRFNQCPIRTGFGVLGKKWTILIIWDIGFLKINRFNRLLESIKGLTPRVLSMRLKELEKEGYIECFEEKKSPMTVRWRLTRKGKDTMRDCLQDLDGYSSRRSRWKHYRSFCFSKITLIQ
jgi:DNA-binding HxlR family transcriptional regulator